MLFLLPAIGLTVCVFAPLAAPCSGEKAVPNYLKKSCSMRSLSGNRQEDDTLARSGCTPVGG
jgi:hypothetical protein